MTILGKFFHWAASVPAWVTKTLNLADAKAKVYLPVVIRMTEGVKAFMDSPIHNDVEIGIKLLIPGTIDDVLIDRLDSILHQWFPIILLKLKDANAIANIPDLQGQLKAALNQLKFSSDEAKQMFWNDFAGLALREFTNGDVTLQQGKVMVETYYQTYIANQPKLAA